MRVVMLNSWKLEIQLYKESYTQRYDLSLFHILGACVSMSAYRAPVCGILVFWFQIAIQPFALFHDSVLIICVLLQWLTDKV